ncbi:hypothetical protein Hanom_Chr09g00804661 [Helianthus anomalus]
MKEKSAPDELKQLEGFKNTRSEWFFKEEKEKKKRGGKRTHKDQVEEGSSSQPKSKHQKKVVETLLVDEPEEEPEAYVEGDNVRLSPESERLLKSLNEYNAEAKKAAGENEGNNEENSSSISSDSEIDETKHLKRIKAEIEKEKQLKRKRKEDKDDDLYILSPDHVQKDSQTPPSSGGRKKLSARKRGVSPKAARRKLTIKLKPKCASKPKPPTPPNQPTPPEPQQQPSPIQSSLHQSPPHQPSPPHQSPPHQTSPHIRIATPLHEQPIITSQHTLQTPPSSQPQVQTTPGSSGYRNFPRIPENIALDDTEDFNFANDEQVKK